MKKILLTAAAVFALSYANAQQIKTEAGTFTKPSSGTYIIEATMTPDITGGGIFALPTLNKNLGMLGVKVRKFSSDTQALRMGANFEIKNSGIKDADTEFTIGASLGVEHHMKGAERLSTYWGYEGNFGLLSKNETSEVDPTEALPMEELTGSGKVTKFGFGANVFTGFDYYIMPKIYLGAEVSYGLAVTNTKPDGGDGYTAIELAPSITPSFRIGWQF
jgi:hypothetical protein